MQRGLARRRPGRASATHDARAHRVPDQRRKLAPGAVAPMPLRRKRQLGGSSADVSARLTCLSVSPADVFQSSCCAADPAAPTATRSRAARPPGARRRRAHRRRGRGRADTTATPTPARRCRSMRTGLGGRHANLRCSSATTGRTTDRFCLSECTSPSSTSNSSQPIHIAIVLRGGCGSRRRRDWRRVAAAPAQQLVGGAARQLPAVVGEDELHREEKSPACSLADLR